MSPDSPEARLGRLETAVARLEQRTDDLATDVRTLAPLVVAVAEVKLAVSHVESEARTTSASIAALHHRMDRDAEDRQRGQEARAREERDREAERKRDSRAGRYVLYASLVAATAAVMAAVIGAVAVLVGG